MLLKQTDFVSNHYVYPGGLLGMISVGWYPTCSCSSSSCLYWENASLLIHSLYVISSTPGPQMADGRHFVKITIYAFPKQL